MSRSAPTDDGMRARVAGRVAVEARTIWKLDVMGFRFRCVVRATGAEARLFTLQTRTEKGWKTVDVSALPDDAGELLRACGRIKGVIDALGDAVKIAQNAGGA